MPNASLQTKGSVSFKTKISESASVCSFPVLDCPAPKRADDFCFHSWLYFFVIREQRKRWKSMQIGIGRWIRRDRETKFGDIRAHFNRGLPRARFKKEPARIAQIYTNAKASSARHAFHRNARPGVLPGEKKKGRNLSSSDKMHSRFMPVVELYFRRTFQTIFIEIEYLKYSCPQSRMKSILSGMPWNRHAFFFFNSFLFRRWIRLLIRRDVSWSVSAPLIGRVL